MNENSDLLPNLHHEEFEMQMRGYSRRQVDEYVARRNNEIKDLEQRLARALDETELLRRDMSSARQQAPTTRPAHEEVSERIGQILKLAEDEAKAQRSKTEEEITSLRSEVQRETEVLRTDAKRESERLRSEAQRESEQVRTDAREQAERMLTAAQDQAERTISAARTESEKVRGSARTEAEKLTSESRKQAESTLGEAKTQAKRLLDEATARASAIHDGAERRLTLLSTRHAETVRRLNDILEGVQGLVGAESSRMSLEEEVSQSASTAIAALEPAKPAQDPAPDRATAVGPAKERDLPTLPPPPPPPAPGSAKTPEAPAKKEDPVTIHPVTVPREPVPDAPDATAPADAPAGPAAADSPAPASPTGPPSGPVHPPTGPPTGPPSGPVRKSGTGPNSTGQNNAAGSHNPALGPPPTGKHATPMPTMPQRTDGPPPAFQEPHQDTIPAKPRQGSGSPSGLIDPDEPAEGFRFLG